MIADRDIPDNLFNLDSLNESLLEEINELLDFLIENSDDITDHDRFEYENVDYWIVDPETGKFSSPRKFGNRTSSDSNELP